MSSTRDCSHTKIQRTKLTSFETFSTSNARTAAVWHSYDFNACNQESCWDSVIKKVADQYPIVVTESGFKIDYVKKLWPWCESNGLSYLAWTWNVWGSNGEGLVSDYSGTLGIGRHVCFAKLICHHVCFANVNIICTLPMANCCVLCKH